MEVAGCQSQALTHSGGRSVPPLLTLLIQIALVLGVARVVGWLFQRLHQPRVVGEMAAGILLGPSVLGWLTPPLAASLFPPDQLGALHALSQLGLLLFMFLVGLELQPQSLRGQGHAAVVISHTSIVAPFALGALLAVVLYPHLADPAVPRLHFALFLGTAMSITAFPVLARILTERHLLHTQVGALAIACAAVDDVTAWCLLAGVVLLVRVPQAALPLWLTVGGTAAYSTAMVVGGRRVFAALLAPARPGRLSQGHLAGILLVILISAASTEWLGIHALFGAFLAGAVMPKDESFVQHVRAKLEALTVVLLLPLFFALTGLRTSIGLLQGGALWGYGGLIIGVAVLGKFGGAALAARASRLPWREALAIGTLLNTRGLMELVVVTIGLEIGVITPTVFTLLVLMALVTTVMTTPLLEWLYLAPQRRQGLSKPTPH
jgi:Kef-type K+ transport system membrane component KefB